MGTIRACRVHDVAVKWGIRRLRVVDMRYVEAPEEHEPDGSPVVFMAGGIARVEDWQARARQLFAAETVTAEDRGEGDPASAQTGGYDLTLLNPRRANFPLHDPHAHAEQVSWEYRHLRRANLILVWFPDSPGIDQTIAFAEMLAHAERGRELWEQWSHDLGQPLVTTDGAIFLGPTLRHQLEVLRDHGVPARLIGGGGAPRTAGARRRYRCQSRAGPGHARAHGRCRRSDPALRDTGAARARR